MDQDRTVQSAKKNEYRFRNYREKEWKGEKLWTCRDHRQHLDIDKKHPHRLVLGSSGQEKQASQAEQVEKNKERNKKGQILRSAAICTGIQAGWY